MGQEKLSMKWADTSFHPFVRPNSDWLGLYHITYMQDDMIGCITHEMATYGTHKSARQEFIGIGVQHFSLYDSVQVMKSSILIFSPSPRPTDQGLQSNECHLTTNEPPSR